MSNIDKQALRDIAAAAVSTPLWHAVGVFGEVVDPANPEWKPVHDFCKTFTAERVLALLDELEAADALNKHLELAIRRAEGCSEALRRKLEAAEERIAELSELPMKSDVEKKPQNTLSGRPVSLGDGSDAKEKVIAGKRDIHRYESLITDRAGKGD
ncbi:TPA: ead/Ea22-like family protein [Enterobacter hormaechei]